MSARIQSNSGGIPCPSGKKVMAVSFNLSSRSSSRSSKIFSPTDDHLVPVQLDACHVTAMSANLLSHTSDSQDDKDGWQVVPHRDDDAPGIRLAFDDAVHGSCTAHHPDHEPEEGQR